MSNFLYGVGLVILIGVTGYFVFIYNPQPDENPGYKIEEITYQSCVKDEECKTPASYLMQSRCPFTSKCLDHKCTVICPKF